MNFSVWELNALFFKKNKLFYDEFLYVKLNGLNYCRTWIRMLIWWHFVVNQPWEASPMVVWLYFGAVDSFLLDKFVETL